MIFVMALFGLGGCKKYNQVDNSGTVKVPYILYIGGNYGTLHKTNDALNFNTLFPTDYSTVRQVVAADTMLLYLKDKFYFSRNQGLAFQQSNDHPRDFVDLFYKYFIPNQAVYDAGEKYLYLCTKTGLEKSADNGVTFAPETNWAASPPPSPKPTSITQLDNGNLYFIQDSANVYEKKPGGAWTLVANVKPLTHDTSVWYVAHQNNTLIAIDYSGKYGVCSSTDGGVNWTVCTGLPKNRRVLFGNGTVSVNNSFFVGLDSGGLYRLNGTAFSASGNSIPWYAKVQFVVGKKVVYRTDVERYYHFCATDVGLYVSENDGLDWRLLRQGAYSTLY